jgi:hypothetical protein
MEFLFTDFNLNFYAYVMSRAQGAGRLEINWVHTLILLIVLILLLALSLIYISNFAEQQNGANDTNSLLTQKLHSL